MTKQVTGRDNLPDFDNKRATVNSIISSDSDIGAERHRGDDAEGSEQRVRERENRVRHRHAGPDGRDEQTMGTGRDEMR